VKIFFKFPGTCFPSCQNGGECVEGKCQCPSSFEGVSCEKGNSALFFHLLKAPFLLRMVVEDGV
jgi:hypothetical protein